MLPVYLSLRNFLSYGEHLPPFDFTQFHVACLTGDNGHGKSALLDAITYALWGEARKSLHERKPDEGLLRLGAEEMRVEFCFELEADRFRVIRSFRKGRRTSITQLELQVFDQSAGTFRVLSESASLSRTQKRIDQLLCMDYDTFINSAFIVQGRSDEFAQRNARQRKEILAEILGLSRYDRLQERARQRLQEKVQQVQEYQRRLQELEAQLAGGPECERQLRELNRRLAQLAAVLSDGEQRLERLREQRLERLQAQRRREEIARQQQRRRQELDELARERQYLQEQRDKDRQTLDEAERIEQDFESYKQLVAAESQLTRQLQHLRELEAAISRLETRIAQERSEVEQRCSQWEARGQALESQRQSLRSVLERQEAIDTSYRRLLTTRQQDQVMEVQRLRHEALRHEQFQLQSRIEVEKQRLQAQQEALQAQEQELRRHLQECEEVEVRCAELEREIAVLEQLAGERDQVREEGSSLRARVEQTRQQRHAQAAERARLDEKILILKDSPSAQCPLCGSRLDQEHRHQLEAELARQGQEQAERLATQDQHLGELEARLEAMRQRYQQLDQQVQTLPARQRSLAELTAHQTRLQEEERRRRQLEDQRAALEQTLGSGQYAAESRLRLRQVEDELESLGYQPQEHARLRQILAELAPVEADTARLRDAQTREEGLRAEWTEAAGKLALARAYLAEKRYAQDEQLEVDGLRRQLAELAYDPVAHQRLRAHLDELSDAAARRERLEAARQRHAVTGEALERHSVQATALARDLEELAHEDQDLVRRLQVLGQVELELTALAQELERGRAERDQFLQRQGSLQAQFQRLTELAQERTQGEEHRRAAAQEAWVYEQLCEAFGKDGIQALIIENVIPEIESEANAILARLTDNRIQIAIESLRDLKKGGTRETLDIKIADELGERSYHLYSGGEAFRTNFALRIALSKVLARRAGTRLRTLIIDEGFGTQDSEGLEHLVEAIQEISKDFDKVLVVTHLSQLKNAFPVQIEVTKHPDLGSRFEVVKSV